MVQIDTSQSVSEPIKPTYLLIEAMTTNRTFFTHLIGIQPKKRGQRKNWLEMHVS